MIGSLIVLGALGLVHVLMFRGFLNYCSYYRKYEREKK